MIGKTTIAVFLVVVMILSGIGIAVTGTYQANNKLNTSVNNTEAGVTQNQVSPVKADQQSSSAGYVRYTLDLMTNKLFNENVPSVLEMAFGQLLLHTIHQTITFMSLTMVQVQ